MSKFRVKAIIIVSMIFLIGCFTVILFDQNDLIEGEIIFYAGTSRHDEENWLLEPNKQVIIPQTKEKIENNELCFYTNEQGTYDDIHLFFTGKRIKSVEITSKNETIFSEGYDTSVWNLDYISFFYPAPDGVTVENAFDDFETRWNNGEFDYVRSVYLNGLSVGEINRIRHDPSKKIGFIQANYLEDDNMEARPTLYYLGKEKERQRKVVIVEISLSSGNKKKIPNSPNDILFQGETATCTSGNSGSFLYRYEKLFYESQQNAIKGNRKFDYSSLEGEELDVNVQYYNGMSEQYFITISFDIKGISLYLHS